ncbi:MAG: tyrosine-type recombinase/integrase [Pirellulales bacterium]
MQEALENSVVVVENRSVAQAGLPKSIVDAGQAASFAWEEFFIGKIRNPYTRRAYLFAVRSFLAWIEAKQIELVRITPGLVGEYVDQLELSTPSKKLHLAAIRTFFDVLVQRHVIVLNPALSVKTERYSAIEGRTPEITVTQAKVLLASIKLNTVVDFRDRAMIATLIYTAARAGAVGKLRLKDFAHDGTQYVLRFAEKGGKARSIPVRSDLQQFIVEYLFAAAIEDDAKDAPLFRTAGGRKARLTTRAMNNVDICRLVKRRLKSAGLPAVISPHSFRSCAATDLLLQNVALEDVQYLLGHSDSRVTKLYDRRQKQVTRNIVERISV